MNTSSTHFPTLSGHILPRLFSETPILRQIFLVLMGSLFIAAMAQLAYRLPMSPVPQTGQTFAVLLVGMALGSRLGALAALAYCLEGIYFPVFAEFRTWADPRTIYTAGYLVGFIGAAYVTGLLAERGWDRSAIGTVLAMLIGNAVIYVPGMLWLGYMLASAPITDVMYKGMAVFMVGDVLKIIVAVVLFPTVWKVLNRR
jgi:biotin transport system substrate-specific component